MLSHATDEYKPERAERTKAIYAQASHSTTFRSGFRNSDTLVGVLTYNIDSCHTAFP